MNSAFIQPACQHIKMPMETTRIILPYQTKRRNKSPGRPARGSLRVRRGRRAEYPRSYEST